VPIEEGVVRLVVKRCLLLFFDFLGVLVFSRLVVDILGG
jgi:hypothetical protein